jgi:hypothetical protein
MPDRKIEDTRETTRASDRDFTNSKKITQAQSRKERLRSKRTVIIPVSLAPTL